MIKDTLNSAETYFGISESLKKGFIWLNETNLYNIKDGKYEIDGSNIYANVQSYETKDGAKYEAHRKYIDIQYMINGSEKVGVCSLDSCTTCIDYDSDKDIEFLDNNSAESWQSLYEGEFLVLFPHDAHKPSIKLNSKQIVKKVVVKVHL